MKFKSHLAADAALVGTTLIWGSTFVVAKDILERWPTISYLAFRFTLAALVLGALFPKPFVRARRAEWRAGATLGLLIGGGFALQAVGLFYTTVSKSAFITGLTTPLVPFVAFAFLRARPSVENLVGVTLASIGGVLILTPQDGGASVGDLLTLASTALFAMHITLMSVYTKRYDVGQLTVLQITVAAALFVGIRLLIETLGGTFDSGSVARFIAHESAPLVWSGRVVAQLIYLALIGTIVTFLLWTWGQSRMSATHAAIIFSLEPVFAVSFAVAVRGAGEWSGGRATLGAGLVLAGVIVSEVRLSNQHGGVSSEE